MTFFACTWGIFLGFCLPLCFPCFSAAFWLLRLFGFGCFLALVAFWLLRLFCFGGFWLPVASCFVVGPATFSVFWVLWLCFSNSCHRLMTMEIMLLRVSALNTVVSREAACGGGAAKDEAALCHVSPDPSAVVPHAVAHAAWQCCGCR